MPALRTEDWSANSGRHTVYTFQNTTVRVEIEFTGRYVMRDLRHTGTPHVVEVVPLEVQSNWRL
jgi:hypothetical protein